MEEDIIYTIIQKLGEIPGVAAQYIRKETDAAQVDARVRISRKNYQRDWNVALKRELTPAMIPRLLQQLEGLMPLLLLAEYITPNAKAMLQQENIAYADVAGNIYLDDDQLFLYRETNKVERTYPAPDNRAFTKTGLKVLFLLLQHPTYVNEPYRFLAEKAGVGLDTINKVYKALLKERYIIPLNEKEYKWNKREELLLNWVNAYTKTLKPKLQQRTYRPLAKDRDWKEITLPPDTYWGGANAGDLLTDYLIADTWTVYTGQDFRKIMKELQWIPDPAGSIRVIEKFWKYEEDKQHVPPLIAYADLTEGEEPRYLETAKMIYEAHVKHLL